MSKRRTKNYSNHDISYYHFLHSMQDKIVTVYRGGPESKKGKLVAVKSDYIALQTEKKTIYYQLDHVKSITEDTNNSTTTIETAEMADADDFHSLIGQLMNQSVQLNQGGPESKKGSLVWLGDDYAALNTSEDGVVYFNIHHIKSISKHESALNKEGHTPSVLEADNLNEVFKSLTHKWVSINRGGPEAIEGILVDNADGHYTLVKNQEVLRIYPFHIKSISLGPKGSNNQKKEHDDKEESKNDIDQKQKQEEEGDSNSLTSSKSHSSSSSSKSNKRSSRSSDYQSSTYDRSSDTSSSSKSNKRSSRSSDYQSSTYDRSSDTSSSSKSYRSPRSSDYQSSKYDHSSDTKSSSKSYWSSRSSDYQSSTYDRSSDTKSSSKSYRSPRSSDYHSTGSQKEDYSYETIVKTIDYHWKRKF
ncbi:spore coat protein CotH [Bacillus halotolerans]|uniref:spore coat protein CotH n=1 Tax=Bacillus halotolerans TaxID=260554 RepID=UPI000D027AA4|nr:spore coat protein CotH [Bacillus halotolerans]MBV7319038.1 spore coat protein CotH [Halalkalibacterium halodurans]PRS06945.1 spore coat protein CotH [Bacillus halotolerans]QKS06237.1 spore coat protein CotH [Bacillus halotolerans]QNS19823.1 spore coat protein CotH [Bacillus halotolerans]